VYNVNSWLTRRPPDDHDVERAAQFGSSSGPESERQTAEQRRHRRHRDRTKPEEAGLKDCVGRRQILTALRVDWLMSDLICPAVFP